VSALAGGTTGERWLRELPDTVRTLEREWQFATGRTLHGGEASFVAEAVAADGAAAVVKVAPPTDVTGADAFANEIETLLIAGGRGYASVLAHDRDRRAVLLERLGRPLTALGLSEHQQLEALQRTAAAAWVPAADIGRRGEGLPTGAAKARWLAEFIARAWEQLDRPCTTRAVERAQAFAEARAAAHDGANAVLTHGDLHGANALEDPRRPSQFKLVDPDGLLAERAYDLSIPMREMNERLEEPDSVERGLDRVHFLSQLSGVDATAIWEWGYVERVSTGLYAATQGHDQWARGMLRVADLWAVVDSGRLTSP
jgi:streptomycin 6-kinase